MPKDIRPRTISNPLSRISLQRRFRTRTSQKQPPQLLIELFLSKLDIGSQHERKQQLMFLKERPTDILIERIGEVVD